MRRLLPLTCTTLLLTTANSHAGGIRPYALTLSAGSLGVGAEVTTPVTDKLNVRGQLHGFSYDFDTTEDDIDYSGNLMLATVGAVADYYPTGGLFHLSGGVVVNNSQISLTASDNDTLSIGDVDYRVDGKVDADVSFDKIAPYLGLGLGNPVGNSKPGWHFNVDAGILYIGEPKLEMKSSGNATNLSNGDTFVIGGTTNAAETFDENLQQEQQKLQDELKDIRITPMLSFGISYRFQ